ncbi:hypothetical protein [Solirubrobacter soli]|uniref:hypothetical protein n=1 Tax=Solirubrobacter soli TaxID=363832 RepID=UPI000421F7E6|nr:hypothetical protein [Solirubrobacter soli]
MASAIGLSAAQLLDLVDAAESADAAARGRLMLAAAVGDARPLDELTLGQRDAWVLALRCGTYGDVLVSRVKCPDCGLTLSVAIPRGHLGVPALDESPPVAVRVVDGAWAVEARAVDGFALAAAARCRDVASARAALISACVTHASYAGDPVDPLDVPDTVVAAVGEALLAADPGCELRVPLACAGCSLEWSPVLDIVHYLWRELATSSSHLLDEIHHLAKGYGWTEDHVLTLSSRRRRQYVERLAGD